MLTTTESFNTKRECHKFSLISDKETSLHTKKNHSNNIIKLNISTSSSRKVLLRVPQCAARVYIKIRTRNIWCRKIAQQNEYNHADCSFNRTHNIFYKKLHLEQLQIRFCKQEAM